MPSSFSFLFPFFVCFFAAAAAAAAVASGLSLSLRHAIRRLLCHQLVFIRRPAPLPSRPVLAQYRPFCRVPNGFLLTFRPDGTHQNGSLYTPRPPPPKQPRPHSFIVDDFFAIVFFAWCSPARVRVFFVKRSTVTRSIARAFLFAHVIYGCVQSIKYGFLYSSPGRFSATSRSD